VEGYGGEEVVVEEDGEMSDNDSVDTNPNSWTNRLVNPVGMARFEHDKDVHDRFADYHIQLNTFYILTPGERGDQGYHVGMSSSQHCSS
jgi:hypothetical protein